MIQLLVGDGLETGEVLDVAEGVRRDSTSVVGNGWAVDTIGRRTLLLLPPPFGPPVGEPYLDPRLRHADHGGQLLAEVDVGVVGLFKFCRSRS